MPVTGFKYVFGSRCIDYATEVLADNPRAYWPLTEGLTTMGGNYLDASGHGYTLFVNTNNAIVNITGPITTETAPKFPSAGNSLVTNNPSGLITDSVPWTVEAWFKMTTHTFNSQ